MKTNRMTRRWCVSAACCAALLLAVASVHARAADGPATAAEDRKVLDLMEQDLEAQRRFDPVSASLRGDRRFDDLWPDVSQASMDKWFQDTFARYNAVSGLDPSLMSDEGRLNHSLLFHELSERIDRHRIGLFRMPVTQMSGPQMRLPQLPDQLAFTTDKHLEDWVMRLERVPEHLSQVQAVLLDGVAAGMLPPRLVMGPSAEQALMHGSDRYLTDPAAHAMFRPLAGARPDLAERGKAAIREKVVPAFRAFGEFLRDQYIPRCRASIGASEMPGVPGFYETMVRIHTTLMKSPDEVHQIGLDEVARIRADMMTVIGRSDFPRKSELEGEELFRAFVAYLRGDPRFYFTEPEALLDGYRAVAKRIDAELPGLFAVMPRLPYGVREMPRYIAPSSPTAYYFPGSVENGVAGFFVANTYRLDARPRYEMIPLTLHEAVPGHHFQIALAQELRARGLPEWRQTISHTAFIEGWALYAEKLGLEMGATPDSPRGLYVDPYDDFGRLSYEMWRAMRLVVDTGIHAKGWTRDQAVAYMLENSALTEENINREVDRYIAWPGQALAYKMGEMMIVALRRQAEEELGPKFDVRAFHDVVLRNGSVPLETLEVQVLEWIAAVKAGA